MAFYGMEIDALSMRISSPRPDTHAIFPISVAVTAMESAASAGRSSTIYEVLCIALRLPTLLHRRVSNPDRDL
jgi:hypothetical protein